MAGGSGTRLHPLTISVSKQLLPVYNKPMIFYPLSTLLLAGVRQFLILTTPKDLPLFEALLGDGSSLGIEIQYAIQVEPRGIADGLIIAKDFLRDEPSALILGDNIFYGAGVGETLSTYRTEAGANVLAQRVSDPTRYGVIEIDKQARVLSIEEKPLNPKSSLAITGLYFFDGSAPERAKLLTPSDRGELEITQVLETYRTEESLTAHILPRGTAWLDTGTFDSLAQASEFVKVIEQRQGFKISSPEEISWRLGLTDSEQLARSASKYAKSDYGSYLESLLR
jgi:glucose-1-phosphate thymidylyltransferase